MVKSSKISGSVFRSFSVIVNMYFICYGRLAFPVWEARCGACAFFVIFVFAWMCFQLVFNDETWVNVESSRSFEEGTIECRNVGY